ncbi:MAG: hypothetical protein KME17_05710 [Cyanosarcina radialis HA8281-LM2]|nr:hypothetical protein [Cyanosarcina radialis HA8281-LM2]
MHAFRSLSHYLSDGASAGEWKMGRWGDGEMGRWGDGEMGRQGGQGRS